MTLRLLHNLEQNYEYVKNYSLVDNAKLYPKRLFEKITFFYSIINNDYDCVLSIDGKKRSIFGCTISKAKLKILTVTKKYIRKYFFNLKENVFFVKFLNLGLKNFSLF